LEKIFGAAIIFARRAAGIRARQKAIRNWLGRTDREVHMLGTLARSALFGLGIIAAINSPATAFTKKDLPGTRSKDYIQDLCKTSKGKYVEGQGQYGCISNCGQPNQTSDACGINCDEKTNKCYGWAPDLKSQPTPAEVLHPPAGGAKSGGK
jgi:hypothetical protein